MTGATNIHNADDFHRLAKLALDSGEASTPEEAKAIFSQYRLRIHLGHGWAATLAGEAALLTALNTAARAFLGGVIVTGDLTARLRVPLFAGQVASDVVQKLGGMLAASVVEDIPTLIIGNIANAPIAMTFCVRLTYDGWQAGVVPAEGGCPLPEQQDNVLAGVASAALGVNEAFLHIRGELPSAGHREVGLSLWDLGAVNDWRAPDYRGPEIEYLPKALWLVGLGHLGQAYAWLLGMLPYADPSVVELVLQDIDRASGSNLSTCMLTFAGDQGYKKTRVLAGCLEQAGFQTRIVERKFGGNERPTSEEPAVALFGVDNLVARRAIATSGFSLVVEAGLGSGYRDFRNIRTHTFPGSRSPGDIWPAAETVQHAIQLPPTYERLALELNDRCGMTMLSTRAVATPFVGALAASLVVGDVLRLLHGGSLHSTVDMQMKDLQYRTVALSPLRDIRNPGFVLARKSSISADSFLALHL